MDDTRNDQFDSARSAHWISRRLTVAQLKDILREEGLQLSGNKPHLVDRIVAHLGSLYHRRDIQAYQHLRDRLHPSTQRSLSGLSNARTSSPVVPADPAATSNYVVPAAPRPQPSTSLNVPAFNPPARNPSATLNTAPTHANSMAAMTAAATAVARGTSQGTAQVNGASTQVRAGMTGSQTALRFKPDLFYRTIEAQCSMVQLAYSQRNTVRLNFRLTNNASHLLRSDTHHKLMLFCGNTVNWSGRSASGPTVRTSGSPREASVTSLVPWHR